MSAEKTIRTQARMRLKHGGMSKAVFGFAMLFVFYIIVDCAASLSYVMLELFKDDKTLTFIINVVAGTITSLALIMITPAVFGYFKMLYSEDEEYELMNIVYFFKSFRLYFKSLMIVVSFIVRLLLPTMLFYTPVLMLVCMNTLIFNGLMNNAVYIVSLCLLIVLSSISLLLYSSKYFLVIKLFCDDQSQDISEYFNKSKVIMNGHSKNVVKLLLSFFWWILLCFLVLPIIYVIPYISQAMCLSGKWIFELSRNGQNNELF